MFERACWWDRKIYVRRYCVAALRAFPVASFIHKLIFNHMLTIISRTMKPVKKDIASLTRTSSFGPTSAMWNVDI